MASRVLRNLLPTVSNQASRQFIAASVRPLSTVSHSEGPVQVLNLNVRNLKPSATLAINELSDELRRNGKKIYKYGLGQSPFPVPDCVVEELRKHAHEKDYLPVKGLHPLRVAAAEYYARQTGAGVTADDILVGPGSKELLFLVQLCYYGDLLLPNPSWVSYGPQAKIAGRELHWLDTRAEDGWVLRPETIRAHCEEDPHRPRILILNYPSNPTGRTHSPSQLKAIAEVAREFRMLVLADEIYGDVHHDGKHESIMTYYPEGTIISGGLSKWCGAGGWRLGLYAFPKELRWLQDAMAVVASETYTSVSAPIQYAAIKAYQPSEEIDTYLADSQRILRDLGNVVVSELRRSEINVTDPEGGFYLFPDFSAYRERLAARGIKSSLAMCEQILRDTGVAFLAGEHFGRSGSELCARIAWVNFDGDQALRAVRDLPQDASEDQVRAFLEENCGETIEAARLIADWCNKL